jgi:hypothetical protein
MLTGILWVVIILIDASGAAPVGEDAAVGQQLAFGNDGKFQISVFEDLHYGEGESNRL